MSASLPSEPFRESDVEAAHRAYLIENLAAQGLGSSEIGRELGMSKEAVARRLRRYGKRTRREREMRNAYAEWCLRACREISPKILRDRSRRAMYRVLIYGGEAGEPVDLAAVIVRDRAICHICLGPVEPDELAFDHVVPLVLGGPHAVGNVKVAHARCNGEKGARL